MNNPLPKEILCENCQHRIILDPNEQKTRNYTCAFCSTVIDSKYEDQKIVSYTVKGKEMGPIFEKNLQELIDRKEFEGEVKVKSSKKSGSKLASGCAVLIFVCFFVSLILSIFSTNRDKPSSSEIDKSNQSEYKNDLVLLSDIYFDKQEKCFLYIINKKEFYSEWSKKPKNFLSDFGNLSLWNADAATYTIDLMCLLYDFSEKNLDIDKANVKICYTIGKFQTKNQYGETEKDIEDGSVFMIYDMKDAFDHLGDNLKDIRRYQNFILYSNANCKAIMSHFIESQNHLWSFFNYGYRNNEPINFNDERYELLKSGDCFKEIKKYEFLKSGAAAIPDTPIDQKTK